LKRLKEKIQPLKSTKMAFWEQALDKLQTFKMFSKLKNEPMPVVVFCTLLYNIVCI
jgi:hypothetical protein